MVVNIVQFSIISSEEKLQATQQKHRTNGCGLYAFLHAIVNVCRLDISEGHQFSHIVYNLRKWIGNAICHAGKCKKSAVLSLIYMINESI